MNKISEIFPNYTRNSIKSVYHISFCILLKETLNLNKLKGVVGGVLGNLDIRSEIGNIVFLIYKNTIFKAVFLSKNSCENNRNNV